MEAALSSDGNCLSIMSVAVAAANKTHPHIYLHSGDYDESQPRVVVSGSAFERRKYLDRRVASSRPAYRIALVDHFE